MFDNLESIINEERDKDIQRKKWINQFKFNISEIPTLNNPWKEELLIQQIETNISEITKVAAVDGGLLTEAMRGFDVILYRAAGVVFHGIGNKVEAVYLPSINPEPKLHLQPSFESRLEFSKFATLLRLKVEYQCVIDTMIEENPTIVYLDGKLSPLVNDMSFGEFNSNNISDLENDVKMIHKKMIDVAISNNIMLCGIVKDSRSREVVIQLMDDIPTWIKSKLVDSTKSKGWRNILRGLNDTYFSNILLLKGERTAWLNTSIPDWLQKKDVSIKFSMVKPVGGDSPLRLELLYSPLMHSQEQLEKLAVGGYYKLCQHGLPLAIPTIIIEADDRAKLSQDYIDFVLQRISIGLGIPIDQLKKRRHFLKTL